MSPKFGCRVSPNPGNTTFTITLQVPGNKPGGPARITSEPLTVGLYNDFGPVRTVQCDASLPEIRMDVSDLPNGTYYLNILKGRELIDRQVVWIEH